MAEATLTASKVWNAVQLVLEDVDRNMVLGGKDLLSRRARIVALGELAHAASVEQDGGRSAITLTDTEFALIASRFGQASVPALKVVAG